MAILAGLLNQSDLSDQRVTTVGIRQVFDAIEQSVAEHNRQLNALMALFSTTTTEFQTRYELAGNTRNQPLDENGRARPIKPSGNYTVGFPIHDSGNAWGKNYKTSVKMTVGEVARITAMMLDGDSRWMRDHVLAALFFENGTTPWPFTDPLHGSLSIYGLANGDTTTYQIMSGADSAATDDHVKGSATVTAAMFLDIHDELVEHPENQGEVVAFVPTASKATIEGLAGFYPVADPNLRSGSGVTELARSLNIATPGTLFGYLEGVWVFEWRSMPADYVIGTTVGGTPALAMRQEPEAELQGFNRVADRNDHPWYETQYLRSVGFGAFNRTGAIVYRTNNATYAIPTGYTSPMP